MSLFAREARSLSLDQIMRSEGIVPRSASRRVGVEMTTDRALRLSIWWGCVHLLASTISGFAPSSRVSTEMRPRSTLGSLSTPSRL